LPYYKLEGMRNENSNNFIRVFIKGFYFCGIQE